MKNPFREMSRPKALATAGIVAGAVAISGAAAAVNVGLLSGNDSAPFEPQKVSATADGVVTTTSTTEPPVEIVYQDVYEQAPGTPAAPAPASSSSHDSDDGAVNDDHSDASVSDDHSDDSVLDDHADDEESDDHESEDSEEHEDDGFDD